MRTFFALDETSYVRPDTLRRLLELYTSRRQYEILPLPDSHFPCLRTDLGSLRSFAAFEGERLLKRYTDAHLCIVVVRAERPYTLWPERTAPADYAVTVLPDGTDTMKLLNPTYTKEEQLFFRISSPTLQPELAEAALELAELEPIR